MMGVAGPMKRLERETVASFLGTGAAVAGPPASAFCAAGSRAMSGPDKGSWNGWSPSSANTRYQTSRTGRSNRQSGSPPEAEMGLWLFGRYHLLRGAYRPGPNPFHRERWGHRASRQCEDRLPLLDV